MTDLLLLSQTKDALNTLSASKNVRLADVLREESEHVSELTNGRRFDHYRDDKAFDSRSVLDGGNIYGRELWLFDDLISVETITDALGATIASDQYVLLPANEYPKRRIRLIPNSSIAWGLYTSDVDPTTAIHVTGIWGYKGRWNNSGLVLGADLNSSVVTLNAGTAAGLEVRQIVRLDTEYLMIDQEVVVSSPVHVERAVNGSLPAVHLLGATIYTFQPYELVQTAMRRLIQWRLAQYQAPLLGQAVVGDFTLPVDTTALPGDIVELIQKMTARATLLGV